MAAQQMMNPKRELKLYDHALMVNILDLPSSARVTEEKIRDRIQIYFQRKRHGGGDMDKVLFPLQAKPMKAIVIFSTEAELDFDRLIQKEITILLAANVDMVVETSRLLPVLKSSSTPYVKVKQQTLECSICMDTFHKPKALGCLHSFCEECIDGTARPNPRMINCPICRKGFVLPKDGVRGLPDNFLIISLIDEAADANGDESGEGRLGVRLSCTCCSNGEAVAQCLDCYKLLCVTCKEYHIQQPESFNHCIATLEDVKAGNVQPQAAKESKAKECGDHKGNVADKFCCLCGKLACQVCIGDGEHPAPEHLLILAKDAPIYCQYSLANLMPKAFEIAGKFRKVADQIEAEQRVMHQQVEIVKLQVDNDAQAIVAKLEEEKLSVFSEIDRLHKEKNSKCSELRDQMEMTGNKAMEAYESARKAVDEKAGDILDNYSTLMAGLQNLKESPEETKPSYTRPPTYAAASAMTKNLLGKVLDTTLVQLDPLQEIRTINIPGVRQGEKKFKFAYGLAVCHDGDLVVTDLNEALAYRLSSNGHFKQILNSTQHKKDGDLGKPRDAAVATNGNIFIVGNSEYVKVYNSQGNFVKRFTTLQPDENPNIKPNLRCIRISQYQGHVIILVGDYQRRLLTIHNLDGTLTKTIQLTLNPSFMSVNASNQILIADYPNARLESINLDGRVKFSIDTILEGQKMRASGVCWGSNNDFYLALHPEILVHKDYGGVCRIHQYTCDGKHLSCMAKGLNNPVHMAFAQDGNLVVTNRVSVNWYRLSAK